MRPSSCKLGCVPLLLVLLLWSGASGWCYNSRHSGVLSGLDLKLTRAVTGGLDKNQAISPFVMSTLLSQVWLAARGTTRDEMTPVLGVRPGAPDSFLSAYKSAIDSLKSASGNVSTSVYNGLYVHADSSVRPSFSDTLLMYYGAAVSRFSTPLEAATSINSAVAQTTNNLIKELVSEGALKDVRVVLVSALYFKGLWLHKFPSRNTQPRDFLTSGGTKQVQMMKLANKHLQYVQIAGQFDAISLPYRDADYSMLLLRPLSRSLTAAQTLLDSLNSMDIADVISQMADTRCDVQMPRFLIKARYDNLRSTFESLGMSTVFTDSADLSGMSSTESLKVDKIILEVFMNVTETGTEAAGAGAITIGVTSVPPPVEVEFILDRPFVAIVWNSQHKMSLFEAFVASP